MMHLSYDFAKEDFARFPLTIQGSIGTDVFILTTCIDLACSIEWRSINLTELYNLARLFICKANTGWLVRILVANLKEDISKNNVHNSKPA